MQPKFTQHARVPGPKQFSGQSCWLIVTPEAGLEEAFKALPCGVAMLGKRARLPEAARNDMPITLELGDGNGAMLNYAAIKTTRSAFQRLSLARKLVAWAMDRQPGEVRVYVCGFEAALAEAWAESLLSALLAAAEQLPTRKSKPEHRRPLKRIHLHGMRLRHGFRNTLAEAEGNALARCLTVLPPNELTPGEYRRRIEALAEAQGWHMDFLDMQALRKRKAGAFLAVAQGSPDKDAGIVHLRYRPAGKTADGRLALVGKGICFDTGGTNLKPAKYMLGMHGDMQGSAVALGTLLALSRLQAPFAVDCWLALAMNHIGPRAYKPNDVVCASNGTSIEVIHTDAEGRMVLADALALASAEKPSLIIDYATLTGACVYSLGDAYSGAFSNRDALHPALIAAGRDSGERVWPFPHDEDYDEALKSDIADVKQCAIEGNADHILAARFLGRFVSGDIPWVHIDLSSSSHKGGLAHVPTEVTGFGVRYSLDLLLKQDVLKLARGA